MTATGNQKFDKFIIKKLYKMTGGFFRTLSQRLTNRKGNNEVNNGSSKILSQPSNFSQDKVINDRKKFQKSGYEIMEKKFDKKKEILCTISLLDGTVLDFIINKKSDGKELYDLVYYSLDLEEKDYFGLCYKDHSGVQIWLDPLKKINKQVDENQSKFKFDFRVKFFSSDPSHLREELTKYQFFLQLKNDIEKGKLECDKQTAIDLAAYCLQSECGDYDPYKHSPAFVSEFRFYPKQDEEMEIAILERYKRCRGQTPAQAEMNYLNRAKELQMYGVDRHIVQGKDGNNYKLGLTPTGMLVADGEQMIGFFRWECMQKLDFKNKKISLVVEDDDGTGKKDRIQLHTFVFNLTSHKACKHLWKCAIEYHTFYRLKFHKTSKGPKTQLFRLGSTFKYRGRTEYENVHRETGRLSRRCTSTFERKPSQRQPPRQSYFNNKIEKDDIKTKNGSSNDVLPNLIEENVNLDVTSFINKLNSGSPISNASSGYISSHNLSQSLTHLNSTIQKQKILMEKNDEIGENEDIGIRNNSSTRQFKSTYDLINETPHITRIEINNCETPKKQSQPIYQKEFSSSGISSSYLKINYNTDGNRRISTQSKIVTNL
ncbi:Yurt gamma [Strongyloides ratti]|uniref:Moesin/ezrin/radixin homolog 1 n=1 Tax=Strongyloides ratti TaxID=34506 RepID=A0A090LH12_STRRB|nr:Yurt gamma [Strongyloides ratti]CEF66755.1 Yurt gamma [Strongyloides ratti]